MKTWKDISGFFDYPDLYQMWFNKVPENGIMVEVGSWKGKSTSCMGSIIKNSNKKVKFYAIDTWEGSEEHQEDVKELLSQGTNLFEVFKNNIESCGVTDYVIPIQSTSLDAVKLFDDSSIDFVHIDASHDYENVLADISVWYPKVKPGGIISGDDYVWCWEGVVQSVNKYFHGKNLLISNYNNKPNTVGKVWFHGKPGGLTQ